MKKKRKSKKWSRIDSFINISIGPSIDSIIFSVKLFITENGQSIKIIVNHFIVRYFPESADNGGHIRMSLSHTQKHPHSQFRKKKSQNQNQLCQ